MCVMKIEKRGGERLEVCGGFLWKVDDLVAMLAAIMRQNQGIAILSYSLVSEIDNAGAAMD